MVRNTFLLAAIAVFFASCTSLKPLNSTSNRQVVSTSTTQEHTSKNKVQFIENISVTPEGPESASTKRSETDSRKQSGATRSLSIEEIRSDRKAIVENASPVQLKYAVLLNTEVEQLQNRILLEQLDEWYGTKYRLGGTTKKGVDCSAFVQAVFLGTYAVSLPRTAKEQYKLARRVSRTDLQEGDLVFFNTTGGVSHVGIYLQNNKFIHASATRGVTISDMFDPYYLRRYVGAGRIDDKATVLSSTNLF